MFGWLRTSAPQSSNTQLNNPSGSVRSGVSNSCSVASARVQPSIRGTNVIPSQACVLGIAAVDGQKSGVWFSPVAGTDGMFVIQGCGFGTTPGQVYLSGLHYEPSPIPGASLRSQLGSDQIAFQVSPGKWSDRQIVAQIDANASGFYDTTDVTLAVRTSNGQLYQAAGFNFSAARAGKLLRAILKAPTCWSSQNGCVPSGIDLAVVNSAKGEVQADAESPSVSLMNPGETIAVARQSMASQFPIPAAPRVQLSRWVGCLPVPFCSRVSARSSYRCAIAAHNTRQQLLPVGERYSLDKWELERDLFLDVIF